MKLKLFLLLVSFFAISGVAFSQGVKIGANAGAPDPSALLEMQSTAQGLLPPRMTIAERDAIVSPATGLHVYNTDTNCDNFFNGTTWRELCGICTPQISTPAAAIHVPGEIQIIWNWNAVSGATGYKWNTTNDYSTAINMNSLTSYTQTGLAGSTPYTSYVWAYNICGASATSLQLSATTNDPPCVVGHTGPGGGKVFYCGTAYPGYLGLEQASADQSSSAQWGCYTTSLAGADGTAVGSGEQNTTDIVNACSETNRAARICSNLVFGGFGDWFLPSKDEYELMYSLGADGLSGSYWTSSEYSNLHAWFYSFSTPSIQDKDVTYKVRCVRKFQ